MRVRILLAKGWTHDMGEIVSKGNLSFVNTDRVRRFGVLAGTTDEAGLVYLKGLKQVEVDTVEMDGSKKTWEVTGEGDALTHVFSVDGVKKAAVWFLGGHVERPDSWNATFPKDSRLKYSHFSWNGLSESKTSIENEFEFEPW